jgi:hypothetical protein
VLLLNEDACRSSGLELAPEDEVATPASAWNYAGPGAHSHFNDSLSTPSVSVRRLHLTDADQIDHHDLAFMVRSDWCFDQKRSPDIGNLFQLPHYT